MKFLNTHKKISLAALLVIVLCLFSYDYSFFMYSHTVRQGESLWLILKDEVFQNQNLADHSLIHIKKQNPSFDTNYIQGNTSPFANDGDKIKIRSGKISIIAPNDTLRLTPTPILKKSAILNHNIQITYQNILLLFYSGIIAFLIINPQKLNLKEFRKKIPQILILSFIYSFILIIALLSITSVRSSVLFFQHIFLTIWFLNIICLIFPYSWEQKATLSKTLNIGSSIFLFLIIAIWAFLSTTRL